MAWTSPKTWVAAAVHTAAELNTHLRDNLLETAVAKVTTAGDQVYATGATALARIALGAITGSVGNFKHGRVTVDQSKSSSTSYSNVTNMAVALAASEAWLAEFIVVVFSSSATPDVKLEFTVPAGAVGGFSVAGVDAAGTQINDNGFAFGAGGLDFGIGAGVYNVFYFRAYVVNSTTPGDLQLQYAQNTSNGTAVLIKNGSFWRALKVA